MPAVSRAQQRFFGMVRAAQKGDLKSPSPQVQRTAASIKKKDAKDFASTKHKGLPEKKMKSFSEMQHIPEEGYDHWRDKQLEKYGSGYRSAGSRRSVARSGGTQPKPMPKKKEGGDSALDYVKKSIEAKYGKGAIMDTSKKKNEEVVTEKKKGLWDNIHAKRKRGEKPAKPGDKDYPKTLNVEAKVDEKTPEYKRATARDKRYGNPHGSLELGGGIRKDRRADHEARRGKKTKVKLKENLWDQVDIFEEMNDWEISLLNDTIIEDIITDVFIEELQEGRDIDSVTDMLCESVDYSLNLLTEVSDKYYDSAVASSKAASRTPEVKAANRRAKLEKVKSAAKKVGSALKSGLKTGAKLARKGAVKGAEVAGKAAGHAKNLAKDMGSAAKKGYQSTQKDSSSSDSDSSSSSSSSSDSSSSSSSSSSESKPKKPGLLSRIGSKLKRGIKKAVGAGARALSRGARNVARRLGEETLLEKGMSEKDMDSALKGHKYSKKQLMDMSKKSTKEGRHGEAQSMYKAARAMKEDTINERGDFWHPDPEKDRKLGGPGANQRAREDRAAASKPAAKKEDPKKLRKGESYMDYAKRQPGYKAPAKKEGLRDKIKRKLGLKREEVEVLSFNAYLSEGNRTGRMMQKSKTQVTGHISADRGSDEKKNREGRKNLEKDLKKHGIGHKKGVGEYKYDSGETGREVSYQTSKPDKMSKRRFGKVMRRMGRKHGQESVITKDKDKPAKLHYTEKGSKAKSDSIGKTKAGKHPEGYGETSGTKVRGGKLPKKTNKSSYHYG